MVPENPISNPRSGSNPIIRVCEGEICLRVKPAQIFCHSLEGLVGYGLDGGGMVMFTRKTWSENGSKVATAARYYLGGQTHSSPVSRHQNVSSSQKIMSRL